MAKKKKNASVVAPKEPEFSNNAFKSLQKLKPASKPKPPPPPPKPAPEADEEDAHLSDDELFERAVAGTRAAELHSNKFGTVESPVREAPKQVGLTEMELFEAQVAGDGLQKMEPKAIAQPVNLSPKFGRTSPHTPPPSSFDDEASVSLNRNEKKLLEAAKRYARNMGEMSETTLRGLDRETALKRLEAFIAHAIAMDARFVRVITGKGKNSEGAPVLKEVARTWLQGHSRVAELVPDITRDGNFGAYIVRLRAH